MTTTMPISDLQRNMRKVADACAQSQEPIYLTRNGRPSLVIMDAQAFEKEKSLRQLVYEREMRILRQAEKGHSQIDRGESVSLEEARAMRAAR